MLEQGLKWHEVNLVCNLICSEQGAWGGGGMLAPSPRSGADCLASCRRLPIVVLDSVVWREQALVRLVSVAWQSSEIRWPPGVAGEARALGQRP